MINRFSKFFALFCVLLLCGGEVLCVPDDDPTKEMLDEELYPFKRANNRIADEAVVGIRIMKTKIIFLDEDMNFYAEEIKEASNFSDFDTFSKYPRLISVDLSEQDLNQEKLKNLLKYLPANLKSLIINCCRIDSKDYEYLADILSQLKELTSVSIIDPECQAGEAAKIVVALSGSKNIRSLNLTLNELDATGCDNFTKILENNSAVLQDLTFGSMRLEEYGKLFEALSKLVHLNKLEYTVLNSDEELEKAFFEALKNMRKLLDLKFDFGDHSTHDDVKTYHNALILKDALMNLVDIRSFDISSMHLQDSVLQLIMQTIAQLRSLKMLNISGNIINNKTAKLLSESIKDENSLVTLIAKDCRIDSETFKTLCGSIAGTPLRYLYFGNNKIGEAITQIPLKQMEEVTAIDLTDNDITYDSLFELVKLAKDHPSLRALNLKYNGPMEKADSELRTLKNDQITELQIKDGSVGIAIFGR